MVPRAVTQTIVLHIGYPKTGTTAIQQCLHANREALQRQGVCYPATGQSADHSHSRLAFTLFDNRHEQFTERQRAELFDALAAEIEASACPTVLLSAEPLARHFPEMSRSEHFGRLFAGRQLRGICFLRRQDTYLESIYTQAVWSAKRKLTLAFDAFLAHADELADYYPVVRDWATFFGREHLSLVVYEQARNSDGCTRRLCSLTGIEPTNFVDLDVVANTAAAGPVGTTIMRLGNAYPLSEEQRAGLATRIQQLDITMRRLSIPARLLSVEQQHEIGRHFLESNRRLAEEFVRQPLDGMWFAEHVPGRQRNP